MILTSIFQTGRSLKQICVLQSKLLMVCSSLSLKGCKTTAAALFLYTEAIISRNRRVMAIISHDREIWTQWRHEVTLYVLFGTEFNHPYLYKKIGLSFKGISKWLLLMMCFQLLEKVLTTTDTSKDDMGYHLRTDLGANKKLLTILFSLDSSSKQIWFPKTYIIESGP